MRQGRGVDAAPFDAISVPHMRHDTLVFACVGSSMSAPQLSQKITRWLEAGASPLPRTTGRHRLTSRHSRTPSAPSLRYDTSLKTGKNKWFFQKLRF